MTEMYLLPVSYIYFHMHIEYFIITSYSGKFSMLHIFEIIILSVAVWIILKYAM